MSGLIVYGGKRVIVKGNIVVSNGGNGICVSPYSGIADPTEVIVEGNILHKNNLNGIYIKNCTNCIVKGNISYNNSQSPTVTHHGILIENGGSIIVEGNRVFDDQVTKTQNYGLYHYGVDYLRVRNNDLRGNTEVFGGSASTLDLPTLVLPFVNGTTFLSADGAPWGWEIDAATEYAITIGHLPLDVQWVNSWKVWAIASVTEADRMRLEIVGRVGADNEPYTQHSIDIANKPSTSSNFATNDIIYWTLTGGDDSSMWNVVGGDAIMVKVLYESAGDGDCATDAAFLCVEIEYV